MPYALQFHAHGAPEFLLPDVAGERSLVPKVVPDPDSHFIHS
jgi:hypothetical protein